MLSEIEVDIDQEEIKAYQRGKIDGIREERQALLLWMGIVDRTAVDKNRKEFIRHWMAIIEKGYHRG